MNCSICGTQLKANWAMILDNWYCPNKTCTEYKKIQGITY